MAFRGTRKGAVCRIGAALFFGAWLATAAVAQSGDGSGSGLVGSGASMTRAGTPAGNGTSGSPNAGSAKGPQDEKNDATSTRRVGVSPSTNTE